MYGFGGDKPKVLVHGLALIWRVICSKKVNTWEAAEEAMLVRYSPV